VFGRRIDVRANLITLELGIIRQGECGWGFRALPDHLFEQGKMTLIFRPKPPMTNEL
jgi:hypothetical protein